jgi:hypothetical protein
MKETDWGFHPKKWLKFQEEPEQSNTGEKFAELNRNLRSRDPLFDAEKPNVEDLARRYVRDHSKGLEFNKHSESLKRFRSQLNDEERTRWDAALTKAHARWDKENEPTLQHLEELEKKAQDKKPKKQEDQDCEE